MKNTIKYTISIILLSGIGFNLYAKSDERTDSKPNVLFIAIDDMNDWTTLFDKNNPIKTPNLERLAERGTFFTKAYSAVPVCVPSRTAILSGMSPETTGCYTNAGSKLVWGKESSTVSIPQYFRNNGYCAVGGGKIHGDHWRSHGNDPRGTKYSWDEFSSLKQHGNAPDENYNGYKEGQEGIESLWKPPYDWGVHDVEKQTDDYTVEYVSGVLENYSNDKPLFLAAGIFRPHLPFWAPSETFERYPFDETRMPPMPENDLDDVPAIGKKMAAEQRFIWENSILPPVNRPGSLKKMVQSYQASADYADQMVGQILDKLDSSGMAENTIIVLWSDHGYHLGDKTSTIKMTLWEKANHVPFIIVAPGITEPGTQCDRPVSLLDIYPTLIELTGMPKKNDLDGHSLVPLLKNPEKKWKRPALMTMGEGNHAVRSERWRYIRYNDGTEELYDHNNDLWELTNLASQSEYAPVIKAHKKWLPQSSK